MNELKSYTEYAVSTPTADFVIGFDFNYGEDAVNVTVDDVPATTAGYTVVYLNETTIRLSPSVPSGVVRLQRETDIDQTDHAYRAGAKFIAQTMDENFEQLRHSQQEVRDGFSKFVVDQARKFEDFEGSVIYTELRNTVQEVHTLKDQTESYAEVVETNYENSQALLGDIETFAADAEQAKVLAVSAATDAHQYIDEARTYVDTTVTNQTAAVSAALDTQTQTVNTALANLSTVASKFYQTLAQANADIVNIAVNQVVNIGEVVNGGLWYKATAGATSLTKSPYDPLTQAKSYSDANLETARNYTNDAVLDVSNTRNLIIDSFFKDADNSGTWLGRLRSTGLTFIANEKFDFGKTAVKADNTTFNLDLYFDELQPNPSFEVAMLMSVTAAKNIYINADYYNDAGQRVQANVPVFSNKALVSGDNTVKFTLTPPSYVSRIRFIVGHLSGATGLKLHAMWASNVNVPDLPVVPYSKLSKAIASTQFDKYTASSITTVVDVKDPVISGGSASIYGFGCDLTPSADFNALQFDGLIYDENAKYLVVNIYSSPDIGSNPLNDASSSHVSKTIVELDPKAKRVKNLLVPTCDPKTTELKTVTTAMLGARYIITYETQDKSGALVANLSPTRGTLTNLIGSQGRYRTSGAWASSYVYPIAIRHVNAANIELKKSLQVKEGLDEFNESALIVPKKIYGFVGAETSLYFDNITQGKDYDFTMLFPSTFVGLRQFERWMYKPVAAVETSFTISSSKAGFELDSQAVAVKVVADNAVNAIKKVHFIGDSLIEYGDKLKALYDLQVANTYTKLNFVGTRALAAPYAAVKHNGYAGKSIDQLFLATIPAVGANPFWNTTTSAFDYSYFLSNNSIATPDFVFIGFGPNDMSSITTDGTAISKAKFICDYYQRMIDSIKTASSAIKVVIAASVPSGDDADGFTTAIVRGEQWRMNRNLKILAKEVYSRFGSSEASGIYVSHASCSLDTKTGYRSLGRAAKNASIQFDTYATYAAMLADLSKADRTIAYATDVADYFVKVGSVGVGTWIYATERDGIVRRLTDSVHYNASGGYQHALVDYSIIKCVS